MIVRTPEEAEREIWKAEGRATVWKTLFFLLLIGFIYVYLDRNDLIRQLNDPSYREEVLERNSHP